MAPTDRILADPPNSEGPGRAADGHEDGQGKSKAAFQIRTFCVTTYDAEGYAHDEWADEILPADGKPLHTRDEDCDIDPETFCCRACGVFHDEAGCEGCGGHGFHRVDDCPVLLAGGRA